MHLLRGAQTRAHTKHTRTEKHTQKHTRAPLGHFECHMCLLHVEQCRPDVSHQQRPGDPREIFLCVCVCVCMDICFHVCKVEIFFVLASSTCDKDSILKIILASTLLYTSNDKNKNEKCMCVCTRRTLSREALFSRLPLYSACLSAVHDVCVQKKQQRAQKNSNNTFDSFPCSI